jgi:hypothetical protein
MMLYRCQFDTHEAVKLLGYSNSFGTNLGYLLGYLLVLHVMTYLALRLAARKERR